MSNLHSKSQSTKIKTKKNLFRFFLVGFSSRSEKNRLVTNNSVGMILFIGLTSSIDRSKLIFLSCPSEKKMVVSFANDEADFTSPWCSFFNDIQILTISFSTELDFLINESKSLRWTNWLTNSTSAVNDLTIDHWLDDQQQRIKLIRRLLVCLSFLSVAEFFSNFRTSKIIFFKKSKTNESSQMFDRLIFTGFSPRFSTEQNEWKQKLFNEFHCLIVLFILLLHFLTSQY